jgi:hypothetical protein
MHTNKTRTLALATGALLLGACAEPVAPSSAELMEFATQQSSVSFTPIPITDGCLTAAADVIRHVGTGYDTPPESLPYTATSGNGGYYYDSADSCFGWVVDTKIASHSPWVEISADAHDLPGSAYAGGTIPRIQEDCVTYYRSVRFYHRKGDTGSFTLLGSGVFKGTWDGLKCTINRTSGTMDEVIAKPTAGAGWDYYRTAVYVRERSSGQQVKVTIAEYLEPPA